MNAKKYIYELVDVTDDVYYTIALFNSQERAKTAIKEQKYAFSENNDFYGGEKLEVRKREIGKIRWSDTGEVVLRASFVCQENDSYELRMEEENEKTNRI